MVLDPPLSHDASQKLAEVQEISLPRPSVGPGIEDGRD
jgi:hypothetical protein